MGKPAGERAGIVRIAGCPPLSEDNASAEGVLCAESQLQDRSLFFCLPRSSRFLARKQRHCASALTRAAGGGPLVLPLSLYVLAMDTATNQRRTPVVCKCGLLPSFLPPPLAFSFSRCDSCRVSCPSLRGARIHNVRKGLQSGDRERAFVGRLPFLTSPGLTRQTLCLPRVSAAHCSSSETEAARGSAGHGIPVDSAFLASRRTQARVTAAGWAHVTRNAREGLRERSSMR